MKAAGAERESSGGRVDSTPALPIPGTGGEHGRRTAVAGLLFLLMYACILNLPYLHLKEFKLEEGRRSSIALTMLRTGEYVVPEYQGHTYIKKPPLFNWLLAGSFRLWGGPSEAAARSVSALAAFVTAAALSLLWRKASGEQGEWFVLPGLIFLTSSDVLDKSIRAEIDMTFAMLVTLSLVSWFLFHVLKDRPVLGWCLGLGTVGLAFLTKGIQAPVYFYSGVVPYLLYRKRFRDLVSPGHLAGMSVFLFVVLAWVVPLAGRIGPGELAAEWWGDIAKRGEPIREGGYFAHLLRFPGVFIGGYLPWILVLGMWLMKPVRSMAVRDRQIVNLAVFAALFLACAVPPYWLIPGSLMRYLLPVAGGIAILVTIPLSTILRGHSPEPPVVTWFFRGLGGMALAGVAASPLWGGKFGLFGRPDALALMAVLVLPAVVLLNGRRSFRLRLATVFALILLGKVLWASFYLAHDGEERSYYRTASRVINAGLPPAVPVYDAELLNPNLTYYLGRDVVDVPLHEVAMLPAGAIVMAYEGTVDERSLARLTPTGKVKVKYRTVVLYRVDSGGT